MQKNLLQTLKLLTTAIILSLGISVAYAAWTGPAGAPPTNNTPPPVNVGNTWQTKTGTLEALRFITNGTGNFGDRVGIGTLSYPAGKLQIYGGSTADFVFKPNTTPTVALGGSTVASIITNTGTGAGSFHMGFEIPANDPNDGFFVTTDSNTDGIVDTVALKIKANGNVGIGTTNPRNDLGWPGSLDVNGEVGAVRYYDDDRTYYIDGNTTSVVNNINALGTVCDKNGCIGGGGIWSLNGTNAYYNNGNVGIGTDSPGAKLHVKASGSSIVKSEGGTGYGSFYAVGGGTNASYLFLGNAGGEKSRISSFNDGTLMFSNTTSATERMRITPSGNVGIGTTNPGAKLDVGEGSSQCCASQTPNISLAQASNSNGKMSWLQFHNSGESEAYIRLAGGGTGIRAGQRRLEIGDSQGVSTGLTVTGNVGIGTVSPDQKLQVKGSVMIGETDATGGDLLLYGTTPGKYSRLFTSNGNLHIDSGLPAGGGESIFLNWYNGGGLYYGGGAETTRFSVNTSGDVGVYGAITAPEGTLRDDGGSWVRTYGDSGWYNQTYGGGWYMADSTWIRTYPGNKPVYTGTGYIRSDASVRAPIFYDHPNTGYYLNPDGTSNLNVVNAISFLYSSDETLKENVKTLSDSLENILKIDGVSFDWKEDGKSDIGFIAQEVEDVYPELVSINEETGLKSLDYAGLIAPLLEAVKEQQREIEDLRNEVELLKNNL